MVHLTLLIPGLSGAHAGITGAETPRFPALETLLAKAAARRMANVSYYHGLCALFDLDKPAGGDLPIAPLSRLVDGLERPEGVWMRADPVHLAAGRDGVRLTDASALNLTQHDAIILAASLEEFFRDQHWKLEVPLPHRWYVRLPGPPAIATTEIDRVVGQDIRPWLPEGPERQSWLRVCNEIQMLLHACDVNRERARRGDLPVNGLWFWGIGALPEILPRRWTRIYSDDPAAQGLAMLSGTRFSELPETITVDETGVTAAGNVLVATAAQLAGSNNQDFSRWRESLMKLERRWFEPLLQAAQDGRLGELQIMTDGYRFIIRRRSFLKFWRRPKSVVDYPAR
jgi:hypothetical protein